MAKQRQYWVVSPNVKDDRTKNQETVKKWKEVICRDHVAIMGWSPQDEKRGHRVGPKFAYDVQIGDIVLIARRKNGKPDVLGFGRVSGKVGKEEDKYRQIFDEPVYVRKLRPFVLLQEAPRSIPFRDVLKCTWAMHQLHPDDGDSDRKVCAWMDQQLELTNREGSDFQIREKRRSKSDNETYGYEVRTKGQVREAQKREEALLGDYSRWLKKQGRQLSRLRYGRIECDAWEEERRNLIEAKGSISREDIRMATGQLFDYAFQMTEKFENLNKAILFPEQPAQDDVKWLAPLGIKVIWRSGRTFLDNAGGQFI